MNTGNEVVDATPASGSSGPAAVEADRGQGKGGLSVEAFMEALILRPDNTA